MRMAIPRRRARGPASSRRRAAIVAIACGAVVALVAATVFTIQQASRQVVGHAASLHALDETLRSVTVVRSQVAFAAYLASVDARYGTDSSIAIDSMLTDGRRGVADTLTARAAPQGGSSGESAAERALIDDFSRQAERTIALVEAGRTSASRRATANLDRLFERVRGDVVRRRDDALAVIASDDDRLWGLGALASFVAAFVVPLGVLFVFVALTRRSRAAVEAQIARDRERDRAELRREGAEAALDGLRAAIIASERTGAPVPMASLDDLAALLRAADGSAGLRFARIPLAPLLEEVAAAPATASLTISVKTGGETAWADRDALRHVVGDLVLEAVSAGARRITLLGAEGDDHVRISVLHDGAPLAAAVSAHLGRVRRDLLDPGAAADRPSARLLAAAAVADGMGADLHATGRPGPTLTVRIPKGGAPAAGRRSGAPSANASPT